LRQRLPLEVGGVPRRDPRVHAALEIAVEVLVGIGLRGLGGQEEQLGSAPRGAPAYVAGTGPRAWRTPPESA